MSKLIIHNKSKDRTLSLGDLNGTFDDVIKVIQQWKSNDEWGVQMIYTENIVIEELTIGCVIYDKIKDTSVVIGSKEDAKAVIESLQRLINCWYEEEYDV